MKRPKGPEPTPEEQRRIDDLEGACNTLRALHEHQGRLIQALDPRHGSRTTYDGVAVDKHVVYPELFKQIITAAKGLKSVARRVLEHWDQPPSTVPSTATAETPREGESR